MELGGGVAFPGMSRWHLRWMDGMDGADGRTSGQKITNGRKDRTLKARSATLLEEVRETYTDDDVLPTKVLASYDYYFSAMPPPSVDSLHA